LTKISDYRDIISLRKEKRDSHGSFTVDKNTKYLGGEFMWIQPHPFIMEYFGYGQSQILSG
jgi:hypothetical protein